MRYLERVIKLGKIDVCDECGAEWIHEEPKRDRCKNRECRSWKWDQAGEDRRTWPRVDPRKSETPKK